MKREPDLFLVNWKTYELPFVEELIFSLKLIRKQRNESDARCVHALLCKLGLDAHDILGNHLVPMLIQCGCSLDAPKVFQKLVNRNEISWSSLVHECIQNGDHQHALQLYSKMLEDHVFPSKYMLSDLLKVCTKLENLAKGQELHEDSVRIGVERDPFIAGMLINLYANSGSFAIAREIFDSLQARDVVLWTAIINAYVQYELLDEALGCIEKMQDESVSPNAITFVSVLKGCTRIETRVIGYIVHNNAIKLGLEKDSGMDSTLISMYTKWMSLPEAEQVFHLVPFKDAIVWTAMISGFAEAGYGEKALHCLNQMQQNGQMPNAVTYVCGLKACCYLKNPWHVMEIHAEILKRAIENCQNIGSILIDSYCRSGSVTEALEVFDELHIHDVISWNSLIAAYLELGFHDYVFHCIERMQLEGVSVDNITCIYGLKACGDAKCLEDGRVLHSHIMRRGFEIDIFVGTMLVDMYAKCVYFSEAWSVFDKMPEQSVITWTALAATYIGNGLYRDALNCFETMQLDLTSMDVVTFSYGLKACGSLGASKMGHEMHSKVVKQGYDKEPIIGNTLVDTYMKCCLFDEAWNMLDEVSVEKLGLCTVLMNGYMDLGLDEEALCCFEETSGSLVVDVVMLLSGLKACGNLGALYKGQQIHASIIQKGFEDDPSINSSLVDMYSKCGSLEEAWESLDDEPPRNVVLSTTLMTGYASQGESDRVFLMLEQMTGDGVRLDAISLLNVLTVCSHAGLAEHGTRVFKAAQREALNGVPNMELHNCLVDLLTRAGQWDEAMSVVERMPLQPNLVTWNTILGGCQKWRFRELGRYAFKCATALDNTLWVPYISILS